MTLMTSADRDRHHWREILYKPLKGRWKKRYPRFNRTSALSSACKNCERSALVKGGGPPIPSPIPARKSAMIARVAIAGPIDAIDIDNWCYLNSIENAGRNGCSKITVYEGDAALLEGKSYDVIIANINRNILLNDMQAYVNSLNKDGILFLSGFYEEDVPAIDELCTSKGLTFVKKLNRNNWVSLKYVN